MLVVSHVCCCCACICKGDILVLEKMMVGCVMRAAVDDGDDIGDVLCAYVAYNCVVCHC